MSHYLVAVCHITNFNDNMKKYAQLSAELVAKNGGEYVIRGPAEEDVEGDKLTGCYLIVSRFPTREQLDAFWKGDEYRNNVRPLRAGTGKYDIAIYPAAP
ncbi:MAG: DUF1330 domain-containing protein [Gammaproteobacteria bacterium]|nr:DUF1330 domain-containing protein [Gammaproteobacteria bacterium]